MGGRVVEPRMTELSLAGNKGPRQHHLPHLCHLPRHPPAKIPKGTSSCQGTCLHHANTQRLLLQIHPYGRSHSLQVLQGPSRSGSPKEKRAELAPPAPVHPAYPPQLIHQIPSTTGLAVCK